VIATLHTPDAAQTIQRIFSVFPAEQQNSITVQLANSLQALVAQRLLPPCLRQGSHPGLRDLHCHHAVAQSTFASGMWHLLYSEMQMGRKHQMQTMDQDLLEIYQRGRDHV